MRRIRTVVLNEKQQPRERWFTLAALSGDLTALKRQYGNDIEVADPSLTAAEIDKLKANFPYLVLGASFSLSKIGANEVESFSIDKEDAPALMAWAKQNGMDAAVSGESSSRPVEIILEDQNVTNVDALGEQEVVTHEEATEPHPVKRGRKPKQ